MRIAVSIWNAIDQNAGNISRAEKTGQENERAIASLKKELEAKDKLIKAIMDHLGIDPAEEVVPEVKAQPETRRLVMRKRTTPASGPVA